MNLREWLIVVGIVIISGILIDGIRRMRMAKHDSLKMSRDLGGHIESSPLDDDFNPELPGGGARVVAAGEDSSSSESSLSSGTPSQVEQASSLDLAHDGIGENEDLVSVLGETRESRGAVEGDALEKSSAVELDLLGDEALVAKQGRATAAKENVRPVTGRSSSSKKGSEGSSSDHEVIVINVDASPGEVFSGVAIKNLLEACGMKHGDMSIFHRHEEDDLLSPIQFSVANAVEPGYFDPNLIDQMSTPGVSFFMSIPGPKDYLKAFEFMNETAKCFAENLHGELKDEHRSVLTSQTVEHCKQRIKEFERKQLCKARG